MQYVKIKESIIEQIDSGTLAAGEKLPSERKLAEAFDTTRVTLREALSSLEAEGKIFREDRRGWFISPEPLHLDPANSKTFETTAALQGRKPTTEVITAKSKLASKQAAKLLELPPFTDVIQIDRIRYLDGRPVAFITNYIPTKLTPGLLNMDLSCSLTNIYQQQYGIIFRKTLYQIGITSLTDNIAQAIRATTGSPALLLQRINASQSGELIEARIEYWRPDAINICSDAELK